jgi:trans-aconitate methyltransferase
VFKKSINYLLNTLKEFFQGEITLKYAIIKLLSQATFISRRFIDGVNWEKYSGHYAEELRILEKNYVDRISKSDGIYFKKKICYKNKNQKKLHPNHELLYETILQLAINDCMEIGCGGGDHLANLRQLNVKIKLTGIDLSVKQIDLLKKRNPNLLEFVNLHVMDITKTNISVPKAELLYTQAVLMHISEKENRFQIALSNVFKSAIQCVVLMENWTQHDFLSAVKAEIRNNSHWHNSYTYINSLASDKYTKCMVISRHKLDFELLNDYEQLLLGRNLEIH